MGLIAGSTGTEGQRFPEVDRRVGLSVREFVREYRSPGRPVVILDAIEDWRARSRWTFEFFKSRYGSHPVTAYMYEKDKYRPDNVVKMPFGDYIDGILSNDWNSFPYYIRDNWTLLQEHPELSEDYRLPRFFFDWFTLLPAFMRLPYPRIFLGPQGAVTPLHEDIWGTHAWLSQLVGRKRWILFSPDQKRFLYEYTVQPDRPDFTRFPMLRQAKPVECTIGPGETVFVPSGWSHWVVSLDATISLSSNYMGPGCFWPSALNASRELVVKRAWKASKQRVSKILRTGPAWIPIGRTIKDETRRS